MKTIKAEPLQVEAFLPFGFYANMINPKTEKLGTPPIEFFRDMVQMDMGGVAIPSFSICRVEKRDFVIDVTEYHMSTGEGIMPLDNDILIHVAPASPVKTPPPLDKIRVFRVPKGTMVVLRPGVWHHAPFTVNEKPSNVLIVLPERTYARDCAVVEIAKADQIQVKL